MTNRLLNAAQEVVRMKQSLDLSEVKIPMLLAVEIDKLSKVMWDETHTTVELSLLPWVRNPKGPFDLVLGDSEGHGVFDTVEVADEDELIDVIRTKAKSAFSDCYVDVEYRHRRGERLDREYIMGEIEGGFIQVGFGEEVWKQWDMKTPCGRKLSEYYQSRYEERDRREVMEI